MSISWVTAAPHYTRQFPMNTTQTPPAPTASTAPTPAGDPRTRDFYDQSGWTEQDGRTEDRVRFGVDDRVAGPIRVAAHALQMGRITAFLEEARTPAGRLSLLEGGCGGNPEPAVIASATAYTGVDFSRTGLDVARRHLRAAAANRPELAFALQQADLCRLPFGDGTFDAVFSAHVLYHIPDPASQLKAMSELVRVCRPGGRAAFVLANPRPLLWPMRLASRVAAEAPGLSALGRRLRGGDKSPLPYRPLGIGRTRRHLAAMGVAVRVGSYRMASTRTNQRLNEAGGVGERLWRGMAWLQKDHPALAARLGNYVTYFVTKPA